MREKLKKSPLAPKSIKKIHDIKGIELYVYSAGLYNKQRYDLALFYFKNKTTVAEVFTKSSLRSCTLDWNEKNLRSKEIQALIINSGNANTFTGQAGVKALTKISKVVSNKFKVSIKKVFFASTGVIGEKFPEQKIVNVLKKNKSNSKNWLQAAKAIMTTDTFPKTHSENFFEKSNVIINGIAKGSGMIAPNMATMLAFIFTNLDFKREDCSQKFREIVNKTFNSITVDGDTSTSDMILLFSVNDNKNSIKLNNENRKKFFYHLENLTSKLAEYIVKDGEGASKFLKIKIKGAKSIDDAKKIGKSIANSPLFKTAMSGSDSNWGRIIMAVGKSGAKLDPEKLTLKFGKFIILQKGKKLYLTYINLINKYLKQSEIEIIVDLNIGVYEWSTWTCDFTKEYVSINTDYRS